MRGFLTFLVILAIVFFAVGETKGWYLGIPGQTPILTYKVDKVASSARTTLNRTNMPVTFSGTVKQGSVTMEVQYQRAVSFQAGTSAGQVQTVFEQSWSKGDRIAFDRTFDMGGGIYTIIMTYEDASGVFTMGLPRGIDL